MVFKKCREQPEDVVFIDASQHYEKATNQNTLRDIDINKIISTYRNRTEENKYSVKVPLKTIAENDYNLNIPRYVETFEESAKIDVDLISKELKEINNQMNAIDKTIISFCKELNISTPF